jgi:DNA-binding transcriptional LysR family regulator
MMANGATIGSHSSNHLYPSKWKRYKQDSAEYAAQLEKELGAPLFVKHTRAVKLTPYGQDFYRYVDLALQNLDTGISLVEQRAGLRRTTVRIGATYLVQDTAWSGALKAFRDSEERATTFDIRQDRTPALLNGLKQGRYDVVFTGAPSEDADIKSSPWKAFDLTLVVNREHPLAARSSVSLAQLRPYHILSYAPRSSVFHAFSPLKELFGRNGLDPDLSYGDSITMCSLVAVDPTAIALVVDSYILRSFDELASVRVEGVPAGFYQTFFCYRDDAQAPDIVKRFVDFFHSGAPSTLERIVSPAAASTL